VKVDIAIEALNLHIEIDGLYHHTPEREWIDLQHKIDLTTIMSLPAIQR